jgi:Type II secretion system (T2SS), protein M subtype b
LNQYFFVMPASLSRREKNLLLLCVGALVLVGGMIAGQQFLSRREQALKKVHALRQQKQEQDAWLSDRLFWQKRRLWLQDHMPSTDSLGKAQGQLQQEVEDAALEWGFTTEQPTLVPLPPATANYREVAVSIRIKGEHDLLLRWLATLQSPEKFQAIRELELSLDNRSKEKTPQIVANLTLARWFKPAAP